MDKIMI